MATNARNNRLDYIELPAGTVAQLGQAKRFYQAVFGWVYKDWGDSYADTSDSGVQSGVTVDAPRVAKPLPVIYASDLESAFERVVAANGAIVREIFAFPGGRRFQFTDPAGNEMGVWSDK